MKRGGDVIPKVVKVDLKKRPSKTTAWKMPKKCPICGSSVVCKEGEVAIRCLNHSCGDQVLRRIIYFASRDAMDIEHMGPKVVKQLIEKGLIKSIADIYALTGEEIALLDGFKEKSVSNLLVSINKSRKTTLPRLIMSLGIPFVGEGVAEILARHGGDIDTLSKMSEEELMKLEGIGEKVAKSVVDYFSHPSNLKEIHRLFYLGVKPEKIKTQRGHPFYGKIFVLTGSLENYSRQKATALIKERGGRVSGSVSKKTDYVLVGSEPGSKYDKAKKLNVGILSEEEFAEKL